MALNALKIETSDLVGKLVSQLTNRPTDPRYAGGDGMTAGEVKARQDALGLLLTERFNALVDALVADPAVNTDALAKNIQVYLGDPAEDDPMSLETALATLVATLATKYALPEGGIPATDLSSAVTNDIDGKYEKPATGIPKTDLASAVQTSLGLADTAYQKPSGGIPATDLASAVKAILDSAVSQSEFAPVKALAEGADQARAFENYSALVYNLVNTNAVSLSAFKVGQKIFVKTANVPDVWIYAINDTPVMYTYTTDAAFEAALVAGTLQVGYFTLAPVEGKTNLTGYATETYVGNAIAGNIDTDLDTAGKSADAKAVGDAIDALIDGLVEGIITVAEAEYANASTYSQQAAHAEVADEASSLSTSLGVTDETPTAMQPVGGTSDVTTTFQKLNKLVGCKVVKNQLVKGSGFTPYTDSAKGLTFSIAADGLVSVTGTIANSDISDRPSFPLNRLCGIDKFLANHAYYLRKVKVKDASVTAHNIKTGGVVYNGWSLVFNSNSDNTYDAVCKNTTDASLSLQLTYIVGDSSAYFSNGDVIDEQFKIQIHDLTLRYGNNDVVNAIIGNDSSKYVEKLLAFDPNILVDTAYDTGSFSSCKSATLRTVDYNQWDEVAEVGSIDATTGENKPSSTIIRSKNTILVLPGKTYYIVCPASTGGRFYFYDANGAFLSSSYINENATFVIPLNARFLRFTMATQYGTTYNHDICIFLYWDGSRIGYEPSRINNYPMPNKDLNGILTVKNGKVVADGDEEYPSGEGNTTNYSWYTFTGNEQFEFVTGSRWKLEITGIKRASSGSTAGNLRLIGYDTLDTTTQYSNNTLNSIAVDNSSDYIFIKDIGAMSSTDLSVLQTHLAGKKLLYPLATPTALTAPTFPAPFYGDDFGVMFFLDEDGNVIDGLQGNEIFYKANVAGFAESLYSEAEGDPDYFEAAGDVPTDIANYLKGLTGYDATKTQTLKNVTGTLTWVDDV